MAWVGKQRIQHGGVSRLCGFIRDFGFDRKRGFGRERDFGFGRERVSDNFTV